MWVWKHLSTPRGDGAGDNINLALKVSHLAILHSPRADPTLLTNLHTHQRTLLSCSCTSETGAAHPVHALHGRDLSPTAAPFLLQSSISKPGRMWAVHRHGLPAAMQGCTGQTQLGSQQPAHPGLCSHLPEPRQLLPVAGINSSLLLFLLHLLSFPRSILREHPLSARAFQHCCLGQPPSFPPSLRAAASFTIHWSGAQAKHGTSSLLLDGEK